MYPNYFQNQVAEIPDDSTIAQIMLNEIKFNANRSAICDYAYQILSEKQFRNTAVDNLIAMPIETLETIADNPNQIPIEERFENALRDWALVAALATVENDKAFMKNVAAVNDVETLNNVKHILSNIHETLRKSKRQSSTVDRGGYKSGITDLTGGSSNARTRKPVRGQEEPTPQYEPRDEKQSIKTRPLVRRKGKDMSDSTLAYRDHATFNRLALMTNATKPEPDFFGALTDPTGTIDGNYYHTTVSDIVGSSHNHAVATGWCATIKTESNCNRNNTILDLSYQTLDIVYLFESAEAREIALTELAEVHDLITGKCKTLDSLHNHLVKLHEKSKESPFADALLTAINRRATSAVNKMIRYSLAIEDQSIDDFLGDWRDLVNYLVQVSSREAVNSELAKWGPNIAKRVSQIVAPTSEADFSGIYEPDILLNAVGIVSDHFTCVLPVSAGALGIRLDSRTSFVCPAETPVEFKYMKAIQDRANEELALGLYDSVNIVTSDSIRFQVDSTDIKASSAKVAADKYLALTFIDYQ